MSLRGRIINLEEEIKELKRIVKTSMMKEVDYSAGWIYPTKFEWTPTLKGQVDKILDHLNLEVVVEQSERKLSIKSTASPQRVAKLTPPIDREEKDNK